MEFMVPLIGIFIINLLFNGFLMWLVITKIVGSSDDAGFIRCVVCSFLMSIVMMLCILPFIGFIFMFPFILLLWPLLIIGYILMAYKGCSAVIETVFVLPDGRGRGILILFVLVNFGVGWAVDKGLDSAKTGIAYAQQGFMSQTEFASEFEKQLRQRMEGHYEVEASSEPEMYYLVEVHTPDSIYSISFDAAHFYQKKIGMNEAVNRVELLMDTMSGREPEARPALTVSDAPQPPQPPPGMGGDEEIVPVAPQPPPPPTVVSGDDEIVPVAPQPPPGVNAQTEIIAVAQEPSQPTRAERFELVLQKAILEAEYIKEARLRKFFNIQGEIPSLGIDCMLKRKVSSVQYVIVDIE